MPDQTARSADWRYVTVGDVVTLQRGFDITKAAQAEGPYPVISSSGPTSTHAVFKVEGPGVVIGRKGVLGGVYFSEAPFWPHDTTLWVKDFHGNDPKFVYYWLSTLGLGRYDVGAANPTLNRNHAHLLPTAIPGRTTQRKIAAILSAYDDLIENNNRRIKLLEEMAQRVYREWFVDFRYPGHEGDPTVESEVALMPTGWEIRPLGTTVENFDRLRRPLSGLERSVRPGPFPYYGAAKVFDFIDDYLFDGTYLLVAEDGSVITSDGSPVLQYVTGKFWANNHTHILQGRDVSTEYLCLFLQELSISGYVTGAAQPKITQANLNRIPCLVPDAAVRDRFDGLVKPMFDLIQSVQATSHALRAARDLLLPRLVSGEIDVSDLYIDMWDLAA